LCKIGSGSPSAIFEGRISSIGSGGTGGGDGGAEVGGTVVVGVEGLFFFAEGAGSPTRLFDDGKRRSLAGSLRFSAIVKLDAGSNHGS
jgi:hypothetical protein